ncbi:YHS domain-containing protein [Desulfobulbus rhabdoformis]|jgi:YHS domain-containing protein|uniref:YHS domain-containing protein n=1 Tax=Desulfobulbus rhabdoformis TaxID=34032 RepID=UPI0019643AC0|nr:YHS domain-containing protein [Desulfobulbus rhabdoformis]MBM9613693.1 YHS domain-containing protein [Desulfobulbus rhabdoformis]
MTPLRLLILAILFYIGWRMLRRSLSNNSQQSVPPEPPPEEDPQDVLVEDPVCHVLIPKHQALRLRQDGKTYYFCSERCCDQFAEQSQQGEQ